MSILEKLRYFWDETLGVDCPDEIDIETSADPNYQELKASLDRVDEMEKTLYNTSNNKGGKGNTNAVVEKVVINHEIAKESQTQEPKEISTEREI